MSQDFETSLYAELRSITRGVLKNRQCPGLLQTTALVHEAWLRIRNHFEAERDVPREELAVLAASAIRSALIDEARREGSEKRGGRWRRVSLSVDVAAPSAKQRWIDLVDLDGAISNLAALDERRAKVVELRFFGGLNMPEIAQALSVSLRTVEAEWTLARAWLRARLEHNARGDDE